MNLYVNCLCLFPVRTEGDLGLVDANEHEQIQYWAKRDSPHALTTLSSNSSEDIHYAKMFWFPCGMAATGFLIVVTYLGWWYQRRLRAQFLDLACGIDQVDIAHWQENIFEAESERGLSGS